MIALNPQFEPLANPIKILHLEDSQVDHQLVCMALDRSGLKYAIQQVDSLDEFKKITALNNIDLILADYRLVGFTAVDAWATIAAQPHPAPFVLLSGAIGEAAAVEAIHLGISDYLHKNELSRLHRVIQRALEVHQARLAKESALAELAASEKRITELAHHLQFAIEHERAAIARDIHDDIGGALTAAKLDLAWIGRHTNDNTTQEHVLAASEMLQNALGASQRIMMNLRPSILDQGLVAATQWLTTSFEKRTGIKASLKTTDLEHTPPMEVQLTAFRTVQEALTNASKYAGCSMVKVELSDGEGVLTVEVFDNGRGLSETDLQKASAFGIRGLQERAKTVGGWLDVSSRSNQGTSIILSVPLHSSHSIGGTGGNSL
jgi:signal transduction histidine kinase